MAQPGICRRDVTMVSSDNDSFEMMAARIRETLFVALLSDTLDSFGYRNQAFPPGIRPLDDDLVLVGRARTGLYREVFHIEPGRNPYELEIALVDDLKPGDVAVLGCGNSKRIAPWGGLLTTACIARGAAGCITDGYVRDTKAIRRLQFPVFHGGIGPLDSKGRGEVAAIDVPIECAGVQVKPGDLMVGDADGIVAIPREIEADVIKRAFERVEKENETEAALARGEKLADVFRRIGVL
jgi:regulator of RNase E activity RraA